MNLYNYELNLNERDVLPRVGKGMVSPPYLRSSGFTWARRKTEKKEKKQEKKGKEKEERNERKKEKIVGAKRVFDSGKKE